MNSSDVLTKLYTLNNENVIVWMWEITERNSDTPLNTSKDMLAETN